MIARLLSPLTAIIAAVLLSLCAGPGWFWTRASALAAKALSAQQARAAIVQDKVDQQRAHGWDFWTVEMENLAGELKEEKAGLSKRAEELDQREARLVAERQDLDRVRDDIVAMRRDIDERAISIRADETKNLKSLAKTYSAISATAAVAIFREMDDATAVKILYLMNPDAVAQIFEQMSTTPSPDGTMAHRVALLSDRIRLMRLGASAPPTP